ncbi:hypothetical protein MYX07_02910 [Patescibacteria group bacterium AH-259-L07]|nr:hypothetical protein [Patescibacteria group bacterium AH-259-L07]
MNIFQNKIVIGILLAILIGGGLLFVLQNFQKGKPTTTPTLPGAATGQLATFIYENSAYAEKKFWFTNFLTTEASELSLQLNEPAWILETDPPLVIEGNGSVEIRLKGTFLPEERVTLQLLSGARRLMATSWIWKGKNGEEIKAFGLHGFGKALEEATAPDSPLARLKVDVKEILATGQVQDQAVLEKDLRAALDQVQSLRSTIRALRTSQAGDLPQEVLGILDLLEQKITTILQTGDSLGVSLKPPLKSPAIALASLNQFSSNLLAVREVPKPEIILDSSSVIIGAILAVQISNLTPNETFKKSLCGPTGNCDTFFLKADGNGNFQGTIPPFTMVGTWAVKAEDLTSGGVSEIFLQVIGEEQPTPTEEEPVPAEERPGPAEPSISASLDDYVYMDDFLGRLYKQKQYATDSYWWKTDVMLWSYCCVAGVCILAPMETCMEGGGVPQPKGCGGQTQAGLPYAPRATKECLACQDTFTGTQAKCKNKLDAWWKWIFDECADRTTTCGIATGCQEQCLGFDTMHVRDGQESWISDSEGSQNTRVGGATDIHGRWLKICQTLP